MKVMRQIIHIDEEKCDGCGECVPSCHEGAIQIIDGKAKLIDDTFCDGLGDCLGDCPQGAITIIEREAGEFDEAAVEKHLASMNTDKKEPEPLACGCPGTNLRTIHRDETPTRETTGVPARSELTAWPVQIMLIPPTAPFLKGADLLITADCVPFALPDFHSRFLKGKVALVGCPKFDDMQQYRARFEEIFKTAKPRSVTVLRMEVPCCSGIGRVVHEALQAASPETEFHVHVVGVQGGVQELSHVG